MYGTRWHKLPIINWHQVSSSMYFCNGYPDLAVVVCEHFQKSNYCDLKMASNSGCSAVNFFKNEFCAYWRVTICSMNCSYKRQPTTNTGIDCILVHLIMAYCHNMLILPFQPSLYVFHRHCCTLCRSLVVLLWWKQQGSVNSLQ